MATANRVLTVTYGTFSCTLEGFDDPFTTLQMVAEYFRTLASEDRHFGATPQMPDTDAIQQIANDSTPHDIEVKVDANGIVLRQTDDAEISETITASEDSAIDDNVVAQDAAIDLPTDEEPATEQETLAEDAEDTVLVLPKDEAVAEAVDDVNEGETTERPEAELIAETQDTADTDEAETAADEQSVTIFRSSRPESDEELSAPTEETIDDDAAIEAAQVADEIEQALALAELAAEAEAEAEVEVKPTPEPVAETTPTDDADQAYHKSVQDTLAAIRQNVRQAESEIAESEQAQEEAQQQAAPEAVIAIEDTAEHVSETADVAETLVLSEAVQPEATEAVTEEAAEEVEETTAELRQTPVVAEVEVETETEIEVQAEEKIEVTAELTPDYAPETASDTPEALVDETSDELDPLTSVDAALSALRKAIVKQETIQQEDQPHDAVAEIAEAPAPEATPEVAETPAPAVAEVEIAEVPVEEVAVAAEPAEPLQETSETNDPFDDEAEAALQAALHATAEVEEAPEPDATLAADLAEAQTRGDSFEEEQIAAEAALDLGDTSFEDELTEQIHHERRNRADALRATPVAEDGSASLDRLMQTATTKMDRPEQHRRMNALDQLKAAVAATEAEKLDATKFSPDGGKTEDLAAYRDDVRRAQENAQIGGFSSRGTSAGRPTAPAESAPLILVSEQRIDEPREAADFSEDTRVAQNDDAQTNGNLALKTAPDQDAAEQTPQGIPSDAFSSAENFSEFAEKIGAFELQDLLEASAAYTAIIEGKARFSRAQVMSKIAKLEGPEAYSKEAGLRSFGKLLREGKILRVQDGQFAISKASRFSIASRFEN